MEKVPPDDDPNARKCASPTDSDSIYAENIYNIDNENNCTTVISDDKDTLQSTEKEENVDSGISMDKSEIKSIEIQELSKIGDALVEPNSTTDAAGSSSTLSQMSNILKNIKKNRNYRRKSSAASQPSIDSDDEMSRDSDDVSNEENNVRRSIEVIEEHPTMDEGVNFDTSSTMSRASSHSSRSEISYGNDSDVESIQINQDTDDDDDDEDMESESDDSSSTSPGVDEWGSAESPGDDDAEYKNPSVLLKRKPNHNWFVLKELTNRELGFGIGSGKSARNDVLFEQRFYGSLNAVNRLELMYKLDRHRQCVNSINFHPEGRLLASGSDDLNVVIWDWTTNTHLQVIPSGHKSNVFQSRFLYLNAESQLNIVTCARDGQVRLIQCPPSGGSPSSVVRRKLAAHVSSAHKLHTWPSEPHSVVSAGEDSMVLHADVRTNRSNRLLSVREKNHRPVPLYSIHGHPLDPTQIVVAGRDPMVRVYDRRKAGANAKPIATYCPLFFLQDPKSGSNKKMYPRMMLYVTSAVYNHDGSEILASYNDDDIYLFDSVSDVYSKDSAANEGYTHRYSGHRNSATYKGVSFFGPHSEFVVSGSDCSNIYVWEKKSEAIVQWMPGDEGGVVNCIECHPRCPVMATSGLDKDVKIWVPSNHNEPMLSGLRETVQENTRGRLGSPLFNDFLPELYTVWGRDLRRARAERGGEGEPGEPPRGNVEFDGNVCTAF